MTSKEVKTFGRLHNPSAADEFMTPIINEPPGSPADTSGYLSEDKKPIQPLSETQLWGSPAGETASEHVVEVYGTFAGPNQPAAFFEGKCSCGATWRTPTEVWVCPKSVPEPVPTEGAGRRVDITAEMADIVAQFSAPEAAAAENCYTRICGCTHPLISHAVSGRCIAQGCLCTDFQEVAAPIAPAAANQCDGCALGLPVDNKGNHLREGAVFGIHMSCTKHKYAAAPIAPAAEEPGGNETEQVVDLLNSMKVIDRSQRYRECRADVLTALMYELSEYRKGAKNATD